LGPLQATAIDSCDVAFSSASCVSHVGQLWRHGTVSYVARGQNLQHKQLLLVNFPLQGLLPILMGLLAGEQVSFQVS